MLLNLKRANIPLHFLILIYANKCVYINIDVNICSILYNMPIYGILYISNKRSHFKW